MVLPFVIGGCLAILTGFLYMKGSKTINTARNDIKNVARATVDIATDVRHDVFGIVTQLVVTIDRLAGNLTGNLNAITHSCLNSIEMISRRIDISFQLLTNTIMAFATTCSLGLLLYLTDFSPFLRTIVWFLFASVCFYMIRNYVAHSSLMHSSQEYVPSNDPTTDNHYTITGEKDASYLPINE